MTYKSKKCGWFVQFWVSCKIFEGFLENISIIF